MKGIGSSEPGSPTDQGLCVRRRLPHPVGLPAGLCANLNLIERLWWLFKRKTLCNQHFPTFAQLKAAVDGSSPISPATAMKSAP